MRELRFTVFGHVVSNLDIIDEIAAGDEMIKVWVE